MESPSELAGLEDVCPKCHHRVIVPTSLSPRSNSDGLLKKAMSRGGCVLAGLGYVGMAILGLVVLGAVIRWAAIIAAWLVLASALALFILLTVFLPLSFIRQTRFVGGVVILYSSFFFGLTTWLMAVAEAYRIWGLWAVLVGLFFYGIGVLPVAILACLLAGEWIGLLFLVVMSALTWGGRLGGIYIVEKAEIETHLS